MRCGLISDLVAEHGEVHIHECAAAAVLNEEPCTFHLCFPGFSLQLPDAFNEDGEANSGAGVPKVTAAHIMGSEYNTEMFFGRLPEAIGARNCKVVATTISGGASSFSIRKTAEGILRSGETDYVPWLRRSWRPDTCHRDSLLPMRPARRNALAQRIQWRPSPSTKSPGRNRRSHKCSCRLDRD